jgi:hypothetical protein
MLALRKVRVLIVAALVVAAAGLAASCSGGGDSGTPRGTPVVTGVPGEVQAAVRQMTDRYNAKDIAGFLSFYTDNGLDARYHMTRDEAALIMPSFIGVVPMTIFRFVRTAPNGDTADVSVQTVTGKATQEESLTLVKQADGWKIDGYQRFAANKLPGVPTISVTLNEFSFDFVAGKIKDGNIAFKFSNDGEQRHEIFLYKIPADLNLQDAISAGKPPAAGEAISFPGLAAPTQTVHLTLADPLEPGRYVFLCFMPDSNDPAHTPHALKGMHAEFTVPASASSTTSPSP